MILGEGKDYRYMASNLKGHLEKQASEKTSLWTLIILEN